MKIKIICASVLILVEFISYLSVHQNGGSHPKEAIELARSVTSCKAQLQQLLATPFWPPTIPDLYDQPEAVAAHPHLPRIKEIFSSDSLVVRPSKVCGRLYPQVSKAYSTAVHSILTGQADAATAVAELERTLVKLTGFEIKAPA